jgi:folate-dependent phosphoribosylglycinamide formyltransferase PurN
MQTEKPEIVLLLGPSRSSTFLYNYLKEHFTIKAAIVEEGVSKKTLLKRRSKKLGWFTVFGQLLFQSTIPRFLTLVSRKRYLALLNQYQLFQIPIPEAERTSVPSVNATDTISLLQQLQPQVVVINGTRILSKELLSAVPCRFINTHAGITPKYRGVHGGYWALACMDKENCGVTIHVVDKGIDTGDIISQHGISPGQQDNFTTYPVHQLGTALPHLVKAIYSALDGNLQTYKASGPSRLWYHPTLGQYFYYWLTKGVK